jgi:hypothetical protein
VSSKALGYVKPKSVARNGEPLSLGEKLLFMCVADYYSDAQCSAWVGVPRLARENGLSERRVRELMGELIRKQEVWREPRFTDTSGKQTSNHWRISVFDGDPPPEVVKWEEQNRLMGEMLAAKRKAKKSSDNPQSGCGNGEKSSQGTGAETRTQGCELPQGRAAEIPSNACEDSQGQGCEIPQGQGCEIPQAELLTEHLCGASTAESTGNAVEKVSEHRATAPEENRFGNLWVLILAELASAAAIDEAQFLRLSVGTTQARIETLRSGWTWIEISIAPSCQPLKAIWPNFSEDMDWIEAKFKLKSQRVQLAFGPGQEPIRA